MAVKKYYAWSDIYNGGETKEVRGRKIVVKRNMVSCGDVVDKKKLDVSDEDWEALIAGGSVRTYPLPKGIGENESPSSYVLRSLLGDREQLDPNLLLELQLSPGLAGADLEEEPVSELAEA